MSWQTRPRPAAASSPCPKSWNKAHLDCCYEIHSSFHRHPRESGDPGWRRSSLALGRSLLSQGRRDSVAIIPMSQLTELSIAEAPAALRGKKISARELTEAYVAAVERARPLRAYVTET